MQAGDIAYKLNIPTKIYFGRNNTLQAIKEIADCKYLCKGNVMLVTTGRSLYKLGYIERLCSYFEQAPEVDKVLVYDTISANPRLTEIETAVQIGKKESVSVIVGFGGGSALDAAKAIAAGISMKQTVTELFRGGVEPKEALPVIAIPTTAGTGSELSKAAILTDEEMYIKGGLRGEKLFPQVAIVDSAYTESVPFSITMETGFDVLAHAIESYISKAASPFTFMLSEYVLQQAGANIKTLIQDPEDIEARKAMSFCSMLMGINLGNAGTALPHRLQYPVGACTNSSHGSGLAALYPVWLRYEKKYAAEKVEKIQILLGCNDIEELLCQMKLNKRLSDLGVREEQIDEFVHNVSGNLANDPAFAEPDIVKKIYQQSL